MTLPKQFIQQLQQLLPDEWQPLADAITGTEPSVSVRVNTGRGAAMPLNATRVPWCATGFYLNSRRQFTFDPLFHSGLYYVQDASSMFLHHVIKTLVGEPVRYLDLCAAPGGKATTALDALPKGSLVVANEIIPARASVLSDNVMKWGNPDAVVTSDTPASLGKLTHFFDVIAADVPCSGEGMMRKDDDAVAQWSPALVQECAERQRSIIADVWQALKPGGLLIYSTCTYNRQENEQMIEHIISKFGAEPVSVPINDEWNIMPATGAQFPAYRFMQHRTRGEGLFMAVVRKPSAASSRSEKPRRSKTATAPNDVGQWISNPDAFKIEVQGDIIQALPQCHYDDIMTIANAKIRVLRRGVELGAIKGKKHIPAHALALCGNLNRSAFATCEVDYRTAIAYLRGEAITIDAPRGYVLVTHRDAPLGWVNNLGNRANNLYPKQLRILSSNIPDTPPSVIC